MCRVLRDPFVAHLRATELALDDAEHVLYPRADRRHLVVEALVRIRDRMLLAGLERPPSRTHQLYAPVGRLIALIT